MSKALEVYNLIRSMNIDEAKEALTQAGDYVGLAIYPNMDCSNMNRIKLIKLVLRSDPNIGIKSATSTVDAFIKEVIFLSKEGETVSQKESRRADALEIYKCMLGDGLSYELAVNATKNALKAFNKEF